MAFILTYQCSCEEIYAVYVPQKLQARELGQSLKMIREAEKADKEERESGWIERIKTGLEDVGAKFIDSSINEVIQCECGEVFDLLVFYREGGVIV